MELSSEVTSIDQNMIGALLAIVGKEGQKQFEEKLWKNRDTDIDHNGTKIILPSTPSPMSLEIAIDTLKRKLHDENQVLDITETVPGYPFDAAVAFVKAMQSTYGWASPVPTPGFFGPKNPDLLTVATGPKPEDTIQVPMGSFKVPGVENPIVTGIYGNPPLLYITGKCKKREKTVIMDLIALAKKIMKKESVYRGKAIKLKVDEDGDIEAEYQPTFIETEHVKPDELIMSRDVWDDIDTSLFTPIRHTKAVLKQGVPLRRSVLLEGPFGTGKSMTASVASKICVDNGWTFIIIDRVQGLKAALEFARAYEPAVVFAEDIDRIVNERDEKANDLLNTIDGVLNKDSKIITVLTTNHVECIEQAMLRPGRLDAIITVSPPDADAAQRLVHLYGRGLIREDEDLTDLGNELSGQIPATIREVVERSKLAMIRGGRSLIIEGDLLIAARSMKRHLDLLNKQRPEKKSPGDRMAEALGEIVTGVDQVDLKDIDANAEAAAQRAGAAASRAAAVHKKLTDMEKAGDGINKKLLDVVVETKEVIDEIHQEVV